MRIEDRNLRPANFLRDEPLVSRRYQTIQGLEVKPGDPLHPAPDGKEEIPTGVRMKLWLTARAVYAKDYRPTPVMAEAEEAARAVKVEATGGGWYTITAPWMPEPEKVQGQEAANARADEIRAYGDPKGVTVTGGEGGWYTIEAAWLPDALKVQGKDEAEAKARDIRDAGPPDDFDPNAPVLIGSDAFESHYNFGGDDVQLSVIVRAAQTASGHDVTAWNALSATDRDGFIQADIDRRADLAKKGDFKADDAGGGWFHITGPGIDAEAPVKVQGTEARDSKLAELRQAAGIPAPGDGQGG